MNINFWALMAYFQDIAIEHSDSAGYTVKKLFDNDLGWVIFSIEVSETPTRSYIISTVENNRIDELKQENMAKDIIENAFE